MTRTARNVLVVVLGRGGFLALSLIVSAIIFRVLEKGEAGRFALCMTIIRVIADCLSEPLDMMIMRDVPTAFATNRERARGILRSSFLVRVIAALVVLLTVSAFSPVIAGAFFHSSGDFILVIAAAFGAVGMLFFRANTIYFQAEENFSRLIFVDGVLQVSRFLSIALLAGFGLLSARSGILSYVLMTFFSVAIGILYIPGSIRKLSLDGFGETKAVLQFAKWMVGVTLLAAVYERVTEFLLARFHGPAELALYSAAMTLALLPEFLTGCISSVFQPRTVLVFRQGQFRALRWSYLKLAIPGGIAVLVVLMLLARPIMTTAFGPAYEASVPVFRLLVLATLVWLMFSPLPAILVILLAPRLNLALNVTMFAATVALGCWIVPAYGATGGAALFLGTRMVNLIVLWGVTEKLLRQAQVSTQTEPADETVKDYQRTDSADAAGVNP